MATKTVNTFAEFKSAVEDADSTEILITADFTFTSGVKIPTAKKSLVINGQNHTVTDMNSSATANTLYVPTGFGTAEITVKNLVWSGRNYYGVVCVYDDTANAGVSIVFDNVTYVGPQMIYNRYGSTTLKDCTVTIDKNGASVNSQEFCEANRLILAGKTAITSLTTANAVMWFAFAGAAVTVEAEANVTISAPNTYLIYSDTVAKPKLLFKDNSSTTITVKSGLFYSSGAGAHIASSCEIGKNASLSVTSATNGGIPLFKCAGDFSLGNGGSLSLVLPQSGSSPLMYFSSAAKVTFDSPKSVLLYNNGGKVFSFASGGTVSVSAKQMNYWTKSVSPFSSAGGFDDVPATSVFKADGENASVVQTLTQSAVSGTTSNLAEGDGGYPLGAANFDLLKATAFSAGTLPLSVNPVNDLASSVGGTTDALAAIRLVNAGQTVSSAADGNGDFSVTLVQKPAVGDVMNVAANKNFLTEKSAVTVTGSVSITSLPDLPFNATGTPRYSAALERLDPNWEMELTDTRTNGGKWALYVAVESELQSEWNVIAGAVTFTDEKTSVLDSSLTLVAEGETTAPQIIRLSWEKTKGVLLNIAENAVYEGGKYVAKLKWTVNFD